MKKIIAIVLLTILFMACATTGTYNTIPENEMENFIVIDNISVTFMAFTSMGMGIINDTVLKQGYTQLLNKAKEKHGENIDVINITVSLSRKMDSGGGLCEWTGTGNVIESKNNSSLNVTNEIRFNISTGYYHSFIYRWAPSTKVQIGNYDVSDNIKITEENTLSTPGISLFGRYFSDLNNGLYLRINILFPQTINTKFEINSNTVNLNNSNSPDMAIIYDVAFGKSYRFFPDKKAHLMMDFGAVMNFFLYNMDEMKSGSFSFGPTFNLTSQIEISKHFYIEPGVNLTYLFGFAGREEQYIKITQLALTGSISPFILIGTKF